MLDLETIIGLLWICLSNHMIQFKNIQYLGLFDSVTWSMLILMGNFFYTSSSSTSTSTSLSTSSSNFGTM